MEEKSLVENPEESKEPIKLEEAEESFNDNDAD